MCVMCAEHGEVKPAAVVDHIIPHKGDRHLFWDSDNWQSLCKHCHDSHKQRMERGTLTAGSTLDGEPLDSNHHWNR